MSGDFDAKFESR